MIEFPFKSFRQGQREAIEAAQDAFKRGKRFVVIEAPTGAGKSAIAVTLARQANTSYLLTAQKLLQDQYSNDFSDLSIMKGRSNYPCLVAPTHAAAAPCIAGRKFPECDECPYFVQKDIAMIAENTVMNYAYYLAELNYAGGFQPRELLVLDEAHNAESSLMGFIQITISDSALMRVGIPEQIPNVTDDSQYFEFAEDILSLIRGRAKELETKIKKDSLPEDLAIAQMQNKQWCDSQWMRIRQLIYSRDEFDVEWVVEKNRTQAGTSITFKPVTIAPFAEDFIFNYGERVLMLSATILDPATYLRSLGIAPHEAEVIKVNSEFPPENRPIFVRPVARMTRHYVDQDLPKLVDEIANIMDAHPDQKGIIHAHTYRIAAFIAQKLPKKYKSRIITHTNASERDAAYDKHSTSKKPSVLLSPSMTEGVDLADDLSRWQVICKVPYPYLGDPQVKKRKDLDPAWYDWRTTLTVVQAYGRSIRSKEDFAVTYVLDADFKNFLKRQKDRLPEWFKEAVQG